MIAFVTSIGERTTELCVWQLKRLGFEVHLLDGVEPWINKYYRFINEAHKLNQPCLRIDADTIPNKLVLDVWNTFVKAGGSMLMTQVHGYDFYRNAVGIVPPVFYKPAALEIIRKNLDRLDLNRPETSAWRLPQINPRTTTAAAVCGIHGFFQTAEDMTRHHYNKDARKQVHEYDFDLAKEMLKLTQ